MNQAIGDNAAIAFSTGFYQAIGAGRSIEEAYKLGCVQISLQNSGDHSTPVLLKNKKSNGSYIESSLEFASIKNSSTKKNNPSRAKHLELPVIRNSSIPLFPQSIAVGLQDDLIQYSIELKFLLLFFEKPFAVLSNTGCNFISEETVEAVRKGKTAITSPFDENNLNHLDLLATEEWEELMSHCEAMYRETQFVSEVDENIYSEVDEVFKVSDFELAEYPTLKIYEVLQKVSMQDDEELWEALFSKYMMRLEMYRLIDVLKLCQTERIPMVWGLDTDLGIANIYTEYLSTKLFSHIKSEQVSATIRTLKGEEFLKEIFDLKVVNLATVPVSAIVDFRKKYSDLLQSFLTKYRGFLVEIQNEPLKTEQISAKYTQGLLEEMDILRKELLLLRRVDQFRWLNRISEDAFEKAKRGKLAATWSFLLSPILFTGEIGTTIKYAISKVSGNLTQQEKEEVLLFRSSSGYLWKAHEQFKP